MSARSVMQLRQRKVGTCELQNEFGGIEAQAPKGGAAI